jgi:hypothetical protein
MQAAPLVIFSRCKPWGVNLVNLAAKYRRVFFGYPLLRPGLTYDHGRPERNIDNLVRIDCEDAEWKNASPLRQATQARNLARLVEPGSIVLVPDARNGVVHCGIVRAYEVDFNRDMYDEAVSCFADHFGALFAGNEAEYEVAAQIARGWSVGQFRAIPLPRIPSWIRASLFGRNMMGRVPADDLHGDPHPILSRMMSGEEHQEIWTTSLEEVLRRLTRYVNPGAFEHLTVSLLQLEEPHRRWFQTGGVGDGGVDGMALDQRGRIVAILQCKWRAYGDVGQSFGASEQEKYVAYLTGHTSAADGVRYLSPEWVASALLRHREKVPLSYTLRIGREPAAEPQIGPN